VCGGLLDSTDERTIQSNPDPQKNSDPVAEESNYGYACAIV
jgi:hypothetical protein